MCIILGAENFYRTVLLLYFPSRNIRRLSMCICVCAIDLAFFYHCLDWLSLGSTTKAWMHPQTGWLGDHLGNTSLCSLKANSVYASPPAVAMSKPPLITLWVHVLDSVL